MARFHLAKSSHSYKLLSGPLPPSPLTPPAPLPSPVPPLNVNQVKSLPGWRHSGALYRLTAILRQTFLPVYKQEAGLFTEHSEASIAMFMCISNCSAPETLAGLGSPQSTPRESLDDRTSCRLLSRETFLTTFLVFQSHCLPVLNLAASSPVLSGHWPLHQYPSRVPINSCSPCKTQFRCYHLCKTSLHHLLSPGRLHVPPFVTQ